MLPAVIRSLGEAARRLQAVGRGLLQQLPAALERVQRGPDPDRRPGPHSRAQLTLQVGAGGVQARPGRTGSRRFWNGGQTRLALPATAQLLVQAEDQAPDAVDAEGGDQVQGRTALGTREEARQGVRERLLAQALGGILVEDREGGIEPGGQRVGAQQPAGETVDRQHECSLGIARRSACPDRQQPGAQPLAHLAGGPVGERDRQDLCGWEAVLHHGGHVALHQDRGLPAAGGCREQQRPLPATHRIPLLGRQGRIVRSRAAPGRVVIVAAVMVAIEQGQGLERVHAASTRQITGCAQPPANAHVAGRGSSRPARASSAAPST